MQNYTQFNRGSEWRIWDLHIHTPGTKKNDNYSGANLEEKWDNYIHTINSSEKHISVIGITDYVSIDNYFKFKEHVATGKIQKKFDLILPNVELRIHPVTGTAKPINIHCIFNPKIEKEIENRFFSKLEFSYSGSSFSATKQELVRLGKKFKNDENLDEISAYKEGINQYVIGFSSLKSLFEKDPELRNNTLVLVSNNNKDGVTGVSTHSDYFINNESQLDAVRGSIYQFADAIFSANPADRIYFAGMGVDTKEVIIAKCGTIKPCFHGCDAHSNDKVFNPDQNRYCWIKADPTFEGLRQTVFEPEDRIQIQQLKPDLKKERFVIDSVQFRSGDGFFGEQKILLNENLNAIIGGKSSGKSLLLYSIAKSIDPEQVQNTSTKLGFSGYKFKDVYDFEVKWKNSAVDTLSISRQDIKDRKITYIPQLYINYLAERNNKQELNSLINKILLQDVKFREQYEEKKNNIIKISNEVESLVIEFFNTKNKAIDVKEKIREFGNSESINGTIQSLELKINECQKSTNLTSEEIDNYNYLLNKKAGLETAKANIKEKRDLLNSIYGELELCKESLFSEINEGYRKGAIDKLIDSYAQPHKEAINLRNSIHLKLKVLVNETKDEIINLQLANDEEVIDASLEECLTSLVPHQNKLRGQSELDALNAILLSEKQKLHTSQLYEKQLTALTSEFVDLKKRIVIHLRQRIALYKSIELYLNTNKSSIGEDINLNCTLFVNQENFQLFEQVNKASISKDHYFYDLFENGQVKYESIPELFNMSIRVTNEKLKFSDNTDMPLRKKISFEDVMKGILADNFEFDFVVTYKEDELLNMSPGKKGTVLLILFLEISSSEFPILIDQPEDNLDNRTIYDLLCKMIKTKKKERQIIIVSHNANLVVATDAENIIVANQEGQDPIKLKNKFRFEYVNGALEDTKKRDLSLNGILFQQGTREHVCDILEGGNEAFRQREKKYSINS